MSDVGDTLKLLLQRLGSQGGLTAIGLNLVLSRLESSTGLNIERDVLGWMGSGGLFVRVRRRPHRRRARSSSQRPGRDAARRPAPARPRSAAFSSRASRRSAPLRAPGVDEGMTLTLGSTRIQIAAAGERLVIAIGPGALADALRPGVEARRRAEVQGRVGDARRRT